MPGSRGIETASTALRGAATLRPLLSVDDEKAAMRRALRKRRRELASCASDAADAVVNVYRATGLPTRGVAALYAREGAELSADPLAHYLAAEGMRIAVSMVISRDAPLGFQLVADFPNLEVSPLLVAPPGAPRIDPDLIIVPMIAFDARGYRLGQGGGYYDRTLAARRGSDRPPLAIGLAYADQKVDCVPTDAYDQRLDGVLTEHVFLDFRDIH